MLLNTLMNRSQSRGGLTVNDTTFTYVTCDLSLMKHLLWKNRLNEPGSWCHSHTSGQAALIRGGVTCDWSVGSGDQTSSQEEKFRLVSRVSCAAHFSLVNYEVWERAVHGVERHTVAFRSIVERQRTPRIPVSFLVASVCVCVRIWSLPMSWDCTAHCVNKFFPV